MAKSGTKFSELLKSNNPVKEAIAASREAKRKMMDMMGDTPLKRVLAASREADKEKTALRKAITKAPLSPVEMRDKCKVISKNVCAGKDGNIEVNFSTKKQKWHGIEYPLADTLIKSKGITAEKAESFSIKNSDDANAIVLIGGDDKTKKAFVLGEKDGKPEIEELTEFHSLSLSEHPAKNGEVGILTSFKDGRMATGFIKGQPSLDAVKLLFDSDISDVSEEQLKITDGQTVD